SMSGRVLTAGRRLGRLVARSWSSVEPSKAPTPPFLTFPRKGEGTHKEAPGFNNRRRSVCERATENPRATFGFLPPLRGTGRKGGPHSQLRFDPPRPLRYY